MNESERKVLRKCHRELVDTIDPYELRPFLYSKGVLPNPTFLDNVPARTRRAERFLEYIVNTCSFSLFLESLSDDNAFDFLAAKLQKELDNTELKDSTSQHVHREIKESLLTSKRAKVVLFRLKLTKRSLLEDTEDFCCECKTIIDKWNAIPKESKFRNNNTELADMYLMVLDAKAEKRRILLDKTLYKDDELFGTMLNMSPYTSSATLPVALYLARYGSSLLLAGRPEEAFNYVEQAKQRLQTLPSCVEFGIVLYIEYNMLISEKYEKLPTVELKNRLLKIGRETIDHCYREHEKVGEDIRRMVLIKETLLYLGLGVSLNNLDLVVVTKEDMEQAEKNLQELHKPENWEKMENLWKVRYHAAKIKLFVLKGSISEALSEMPNVAYCAMLGNCKQELKSIKETFALLNERQNLSLK